MTSAIWTGTPSCVGRSCHGGLEPRVGGTVLQNELTTVQASDPHARAYQILFDERSIAMAKRLGQADGQAHRMPRCLACHASPMASATPPVDATLVSAEFAFGVGCESCHGPAAQWIDEHTRFHDAAARASWIGYVDLSDSRTRAATCARCHVGAGRSATMPARDVDHDLIAAGHPRLLFEFVSLQDAMPAHWKPKNRDAGLDWFVGQVESAKANLSLLRDRVESGATWPEFAEYDCFACHHDLAAKSWRQSPRGSRKAGTLPWNSWSSDVILRLLEIHSLPTAPWKDLRTSMESLAMPDRAKLLAQIDRASASLVDLSRRAEYWSGPLGQLSAFVKTSVERPVESWESAEQQFFAARALQTATNGHEDLVRELEKRRGLEPGYTSPRRFHPVPGPKK